jgi:Phage integrase, N-terminal SAM-like domain/Phage integrase family
MTCMTWVSPSRSSCWMRLPSAVHHASGRFDARAAGAHAGLGGGVVDSARRRPGALRAGGAVPGVLGLDRKSPNTVKGYAHDLQDWFTYLAGHDLGWQVVTVEDVAGFVAWLRLPPEARDGKVAVLPCVGNHCSSASVNRKLAALTSFCEFYARHGVRLAGLLTRDAACGRRGSATSYKPFLHHISKSGPQLQRTIKLKTSRLRPKVLTAVEVQTILDACDHLRDRLLFALLLDCGVRIGEALGLRHEDMGSPTGPSPSCRGLTTTGPAPRPGSRG